MEEEVIVVDVHLNKDFVMVEIIIGVMIKDIDKDEEIFGNVIKVYDMI